MFPGKLQGLLRLDGRARWPASPGSPRGSGARAQTGSTTSRSSWTIQRQSWKPSGRWPDPSGLSITRGGAFFISRGITTRGEARVFLCARSLRPDARDCSWTASGLGTAPTTFPCSKAVDFPVLVQKPGGRLRPIHPAPGQSASWRRARGPSAGTPRSSISWPVSPADHPIQEVIMADFYQTGVITTFHRLGTHRPGTYGAGACRIQPSPAHRPCPSHHPGRTGLDRPSRAS